MNRILILVAACALSSVAAAMVHAADRDAERASIEKSIASYTAAFNERDANKLAGHWSADAIYANPVTGKEVEGRAAIAKEFESVLAEAGESKLAVEVESIRFISPQVAVESGVANLVASDGTTTTSSYNAVHIKQDGKWLLDRVSEEDISAAPSHFAQLRELEWLIGTWEDSDDESKVETTFQWTRNKNFIVRYFAATIGDRVDMAGMQLIGWDPVNKQIRSWTFDSDGGYASGKWTHNEDSWSIAMVGTTPDGRRATAVNVITPVGDDRYEWRSVNRMVSGKLLPNIDSIPLIRVAAGE